MVGAGVRSCYDEGKRTAETLTMDYHRGANVEVGLSLFFLLPFKTSYVSLSSSICQERRDRTMNNFCVCLVDCGDRSGLLGSSTPTVQECA